MTLDRRKFLKNSAFAAGSLATLSLHEEDAQANRASLPQRTLGRTKQRVSLLGLGMAPLGSNNTASAEAEAVVHAALDTGITYVDVSPDYGDAEAKLKNVLAKRRDGLFLVTKVNPNRPTKDDVQKQIEESLKRMGTDHADLVHIHNLGDFDMNTVFAPGGALEGLKEARKRGLIRFIGVSGHYRPPRFVTALETGEIDVLMNALNFADRHNYRFEELVLPVAKKHNTGVVAMKVLGGAKQWRYDAKTPANFADYHEKAIRYSLGIPGVCCAVIGLSSAKEIQQAVAVARKFKPLTPQEKAELLQEGEKLARERGLYYGPIAG